MLGGSVGAAYATAVTVGHAQPALAAETAPSAVAAAGPGAAPDPGTRTFFVSPAGDDSALGTQSRPWKTIEHARDAIREWGLTDPQRMHGDITVNVRAGDYEVAQTITFDERDSGASGHQVIYRSYDGPGQARLLGARQITGWQPYQNGIYRAQVPANEPFYTLFENDQRAVTARYPNIGDGPTVGPYLQSADSSDDALTNSTTWLAFNAGDWNENWNLGEYTTWPAQVVVWSGGHWSWFTDTVPILNVSWTKNFVTLNYPARYSLFSQVGSRYFIQNSLDFLDQPGEYFLDPIGGWLYYMPRNGSLDNSTMWAPTVTTLIEIAGSSPDQRAQDITFDGFALEYSDFMQWYRYGWNATGDSGLVHKYPDYDRQIEMTRNRHGMITLTNTRGITLNALNISNTGFHAIYSLFANDHVAISNSLFAHIGADAIKIEGGYPGEGNISHDHTVTNNYINYVGELVPGDASGVEILDTGNTTVSHCEILHSPRYAVALKSITTVANADQYCNNITLEYLKVAHAGLDSGDMGAIDAYGVSNDPPYTVNKLMNQITVTDVNADPSMPDVPPSGIHMDSGGEGFNFTNIVITDTEYTTPFHGDTHNNTFSNCSWLTGFDDSLMQYDQIGVTADFPYATEAAALGD
jgi:hypothetical protein